jgi:predicted aldo/keto reductase-like oxidoreductase
VLQFDQVIPDPGIEKLSEMQEIVSIVNAKQPFSTDDKRAAAEVVQALGDRWCHRCDYCQPCPQGIPISSVLTVESLIKRMPFRQAFQMANASVEKAGDCIECGRCVERCPYKLQIPGLLKDKIDLWKKAVAENPV